ncbi:hypothetical protein BDM02DRAFT_318271 [Thelephora ganbajun]|uniref:Uncharacterized protein n=1 Tax=Thelephora ganbajun TaxID=370292 RepID=A0ACB6Z950_THEGA|nr:hypothetical protein BDM02DRAFT_318271 [Thelephora ganbajun]
MIAFINLVFAIAMALLTKAAPVPRSQVTRRASGNKIVTAHHMVGNTYPYTNDTWLRDIRLAHDHGIDAFALNIGTNDWEPTQVANAYQAAKDSGTNFKLFISFDMTVMPCSSPQHATALRDYITRYADHPNQLRYNGNIFASTFAGDTCTFGSGSSVDGWKSQFVDQLSGNNKVHLVPAFFSDPNTFKNFDNVIDGVYHWNSGWPVELTPEKASSLLQPLGGSLTAHLDSPILSNLVGSIQPDKVYLGGLSNMQNTAKTYMAAVSPWFFTHFGADSFNKNWIYMSNDHLYNKRWETIISNRNEIDIVQIISWNDYGESHYIGPIEGDQPHSQAWVNGFNHTAWLDMTTYYANAFKTGSFPAIDQDKIYLWARPHPRDATASSDPLGKPQSYQLMDDAVYAVVMATSPSKVTLSTSPSSSQTFDVPAGVTKLTLPISAGGTMYGKVERNGNTIVELNPDFTFDPNPKTYNYNAMVTFASGNNTQPASPPGKDTPVDNTSSSTVVSSSLIPDVPVATPSSSSTSDVQPSPAPSPSPSPSPSEGPTSNPTPTPSPSPTQSNPERTCMSRRRHRRSYH